MEKEKLTEMCRCCGGTGTEEYDHYDDYEFRGRFLRDCPLCKGRKTVKKGTYDNLPCNRPEQQAQPDEEFIQNTYDEIYTHITYDADMRISIDEDEVKNIIRKLLQDKK